MRAALASTLVPFVLLTCATPSLAAAPKERPETSVADASPPGAAPAANAQEANTRPAWEYGVPDEAEPAAASPLYDHVAADPVRPDRAFAQVGMCMPLAVFDNACLGGLIQRAWSRCVTWAFCGGLLGAALGCVVGLVPVLIADSIIRAFAAGIGQDPQPFLEASGGFVLAVLLGTSATGCAAGAGTGAPLGVVSAVFFPGSPPPPPREGAGAPIVDDDVPPDDVDSPRKKRREKKKTRVERRKKKKRDQVKKRKERKQKRKTQKKERASDRDGDGQKRSSKDRSGSKKPRGDAVNAELEERTKSTKDGVEGAE